MKLRIRAATTVLGTSALVGALLVAVASSAAATTPPYEPDSADQIGQLRLYNASGTQITTGSINDSPIAAFAVATNDDPQTANNHATLYAYTPVNGVNPQLWTGHAISGSTAFPVASPASIHDLGAHRPVVSLTATDGSFADYIADVPNTDTTTNYAGLYQIRIKTLNNDPKFWAADIQVTGSTWTLVYPTAATQDNSSMTISASKTISYGSSTTTSTTLRDTTTSHVIGSAAVKLYKRPSTSSPWAFVANATTNSSGVASKSVAPTGKTLYQWRYAGSSTHKAATSPTETISVKQVVSAHSTKSTVAHGVTFKIWGTVKPASSGKTVTLQRLSGTTWKSISSVTIKKQKLPNGVTTSGFVFSVKQSTKGTFKYRVYRPATSTLLAGYSSTLTVKVT
jgi:hypothetical protein